MMEQSMHAEKWQMRAFSGYGRIIRALLTGELTAGLVPWELFTTELLCKPGQKDRWMVPLVIQACPMELVLSSAAVKRLRPGPQKKGDPAPAKLLFGIEERRSYTRFQILEWLKSLNLPHLESPTFKVLPMELLLKGLKAGVVDGVIAPTPWGMQAEASGIGVISPDFKAGEYEQQVVLVCLRSIAENCSAVLQSLPARLAQSHQNLAKEPSFLNVARHMAGLGTPRFEPSLLWKAAGVHLKGVTPKNFIPDAGWLSTELDLVHTRSMVGSSKLELEKTAQKLEMTLSSSSLV